MQGTEPLHTFIPEPGEVLVPQFNEEVQQMSEFYCWRYVVMQGL